MSPAVRTIALTKRYGGRTAVEGIDLELSAGDCLALLGLNGAGKSTLLRLIASLARPTSGEVWLFGERCARGGAPPAARRAVGYTGHALLLYRRLTSRQNLEFLARLYGLDSPRQRAEAALEQFDLGGRADDPAGELSRGMQQRLSLARTFLHGPELLLLDEPYSALDTRGCRALDEAIQTVSARGGTIILATHDLSRVSGRAGEVAILRRGHLAHRGAAPPAPAGWAELYQRCAGEVAA